MTSLQAFMAQNVVQLEVEKHEVSPRFQDKEGKAIKWHFGAIDGSRDAALRKECTRRVQVPMKKGMTMPELDGNRYSLKLAVESIKMPDLNNTELQNSYGVMGAEELLQKMLLPGELTKVKELVQTINGFDLSMDELVDEAKN
ncbi:phage tail assembly chaperone [Solibacillus sp. FSL K6-1523]|uniref:phage tail assembly chaperone n=1 Tax=Solibacillus sp. FSL K6-1523 TaxID=2921471 RepID=UPI0030FB71E1